MSRFKKVCWVSFWPECGYFWKSVQAIMDWYVGCEVLDRIQLLVYIKSTDNNWCQFWFDGQEAQLFWRLRNDCLIMYSFHPEKINAASEHCFNFGISHGTIVYNLCSIILTMNSSIIWLLVDIYIYIYINTCYWYRYHYYHSHHCSNSWFPNVNCYHNAVFW